MLKTTARLRILGYVGQNRSLRSLSSESSRTPPRFAEWAAVPASSCSVARYASRHRRTVGYASLRYIPPVRKLCFRPDGTSHIRRPLCKKHRKFIFYKEEKFCYSLFYNQFFHKIWSQLLKKQKPNFWKW